MIVQSLSKGDHSAKEYRRESAFARIQKYCILLPFLPMSKGSNIIKALTTAFVRAEPAGNPMVRLALDNILQHKEALMRCIDLLQQGKNPEALSDNRYEATALMSLQGGLAHLQSGVVPQEVSDAIADTVQRYRETIGAPTLPDDVTPFTMPERKKIL